MVNGNWIEIKASIVFSNQLKLVYCALSIIPSADQLNGITIAFVPQYKIIRLIWLPFMKVNSLNKSYKVKFKIKFM